MSAVTSSFLRFILSVRAAKNTFTSTLERKTHAHSHKYCGGVLDQVSWSLQMPNQYRFRHFSMNFFHRPEPSTRVNTPENCLPPVETGSDVSSPPARSELLTAERASAVAGDRDTSETSENRSPYWQPLHITPQATLAACHKMGAKVSKRNQYSILSG